MKMRMILLASALLWLLAMPGSTSAQQDEGIGLTIFTGAQNSPTSFDAFRSVEYDAGVRFGAGVIFVIDEYVSVRGTVALSNNTGSESGAVSEDIDFSRQYYGAQVQVQYPATSTLSPYVFAGGGLVTVERSAQSYSYDMTEGAGLFGVGASFRLNESLALYAEGQGWIYSRQTVGDTQLDKTVNVGLTYHVPF